MVQHFQPVATPKFNQMNDYNWTDDDQCFDELTVLWDELSNLVESTLWPKLHCYNLILPPFFDKGICRKQSNAHHWGQLGNLHTRSWLSLSVPTILIPTAFHKHHYGAQVLAGESSNNGFICVFGWCLDMIKSPLKLGSWFDFQNKCCHKSFACGLESLPNALMDSYLQSQDLVSLAKELANLSPVEITDERNLEPLNDSLSFYSLF
jgi:hypothetical protein